VRAGLESVGWQTADLMRAMAADGIRPKELKVDGGMVANAWFLQFLADVLGVPVERPSVAETTALGAAYLAGLAAGVYAGTDEIARLWRGAGRFEPALASADREKLHAGWRNAVARVLTRKES